MPSLKPPWKPFSGWVRQHQVQRLGLLEGSQGPARDHAEPGAVVMWHSVAVGAIAEAAIEALQGPGPSASGAATAPARRRPGPNATLP